MFRKKYLNLSEIEELLNASDSEDDEIGEDAQIRKANAIDIVVLPPDKVDCISDCEDINDDIQLQSDFNETLSIETVGQIEIFCEYSDEKDGNPVIIDESDVSMEEVTPKEPRFIPPRPKWTKRRYRFSKSPVDLTGEKTIELVAKIGNLII